MKPVKYFILCLLLFVTSISRAQTNKFEIGVDAGPSVRDLWPSLVNMPTIGVYTSIYFQYNISKLISIKSGISYDLKGTGVFNNTYFPAPFLISGGTVDLNYLTLPILAKATLGKKIKFFLDAGPYLSVLVHAYQNNGLGTGNNLYKKGDLKPYDSGIQAGVGITIPIKQQFEFSFEDRNSIGLLNIRRSGYAEIKTLSSSFLLGVNYKFGKKKTQVKRTT